MFDDITTSVWLIAILACVVLVTALGGLGAVFLVFVKLRNEFRHSTNGGLEKISQAVQEGIDVSNAHHLSVTAEFGKVHSQIKVIQSTVKDIRDTEKTIFRKLDGHTSDIGVLQGQMRPREKADA